MRKRNVRYFAGVVLLAACVSAADTTPSDPITRASAALNGVFSPRGFFNILVRLGKTPGVKAVKLDLKLSRITIDFAPGYTITQEQMVQILIEAGYRPGTITLRRIAADQALETAPGWMRIKQPKSKNPVVRWAEENF